MELRRRNFLTTPATTAATSPLTSAADKSARSRDWIGETPVTYPEPAWEVMDRRFSGRQFNALESARRYVQYRRQKVTERFQTGDREALEAKVRKARSNLQRK